MKLILLLIIILCLGLINAEYHIKEGKSDSYLYYEINAVNEMNYQIKLYITLNKIEGTLLYMIDKYGNQLIINIYNEGLERMIMEFRGESHYASLSELCGCVRCKYRLIELMVSITDRISIQCNDQPYKSFRYWDKQEVNKAYPIQVIFDKFQAALWLVNTPSLGDGQHYSNPEQLVGCIHEISFNGNPLQMAIYGTEISTKCPKACVNDVCNAGVCHETYSIKPFCDCTDSFLNGPFCNSTGTVGMDPNWRYPYETFDCKFIKISWRADSGAIFGIENLKISVKVRAEGNELCLVYNETDEKYLTNKTITDKYQPNQNGSLYLSFGANVIGIKFVQNNSTINTKSYVAKDLSKEHFTSISMLSAPGFIDIVHKLRPSQYQWLPFHSKFFVNKSTHRIIGNNSSKQCQGQKGGMGRDSGSVGKDVAIGILSFLLVIFIISTVYFAVISNWKREKRMEKQNGANHSLISGPEDGAKGLLYNSMLQPSNEQDRSDGSGSDSSKRSHSSLPSYCSDTQQV